MKSIVRRALALALALAALGPLDAIAQDGPIRQRIKERIAQRQQKAEAPITKPGDHDFTIEHDGLSRSYRVHVPRSYDPARPAPLVFALHGGGGSMEYMARDERYAQVPHSEKYGIVMVFPNGYSKLRSGKLATWNAGRCCGGARDDNVDDVGFIRRIVENVTTQLNIDRHRIYATGMSNGGLMAYRLACEMPEVFRAIAPVAGTDNTVQCQPSRAVSVLHIHAKNDTHVLFNGGAGPGSRDKSAVTEFTSVPDTIAKWVRLNACTPTPRRVLDTPGAWCDLYSGCRDRAEVQLCVTESGGHSWPGAEKTRGEPASQAISANEVMWEFFSRH